MRIEDRQLVGGTGWKQEAEGYWSGEVDNEDWDKGHFTYYENHQSQLVYYQLVVPPSSLHPSLPTPTCA